MKTGTVILVALIFLLSFCFIRKSAYKRGYEQGAWHTALHLKATGYLPSMLWRDNHHNDDIQTPEQLLKISPEITFINKDKCISLGR